MLEHRADLNKDELEKLFLTHTVTMHFKVEAYPELSSHSMPDIRLDSGIYYVNSMESLSSATELEAISAKNIVNMIVNQV